MGIKKRSKVSAEFSMSSLTDIIFLLLIFFMLTSSLVAPNALNLKLPGSSKTKVTTTSKTDDVSIRKDGRYYLNNKRVELAALDQQLARMAKGKSGKLNITISPDSGTPTEYVVAIMDIALRYHINGILVTELSK
ncbi:MAG: biopolymer transporter ExbD [Saprospiraceae bacterium]|nr:MAG: biopolymer transporter ExbD [Saprospiraceae bacterium]